MRLKNVLKKKQGKRLKQTVLQRWKLFVSKWRLRKRLKMPNEQQKNSKCAKRWRSWELKSLPNKMMKRQRERPNSAKHSSELRWSRSLSKSVLQQLSVKESARSVSGNRKSRSSFARLHKLNLPKMSKRCWTGFGRPTQLLMSSDVTRSASVPIYTIRWMTSLTLHPKVSAWSELTIAQRDTSTCGTATNLEIVSIWWISSCKNTMRLKWFLTSQTSTTTLTGILLRQSSLVSNACLWRTCPTQ